MAASEVRRAIVGRIPDTLRNCVNKVRKIGHKKLPICNSVFVTSISFLLRNTSQAVALTLRGWMVLGITGTCQSSRLTPPPLTRLLTVSLSLLADLQEDLPQVPWGLFKYFDRSAPCSCLYTIRCQDLQEALPSRYLRRLSEIFPSGNNQNLILKFYRTLLYLNTNTLTRAEMAKSLVGTGREPVQEPPNHHPGTNINWCTGKKPPRCWNRYDKKLIPGICRICTWYSNVYLGTRTCVIHIVYGLFRVYQLYLFIIGSLKEHFVHRIARLQITDYQIW